MVSYLLRMMSSWAMVCSVWYLPPMGREVNLTLKSWKALGQFLERVMRSSRAHFLCVLLPSLLHAGRWGCCAVCQQGESSHSWTRRSGGSQLVSLPLYFSVKAVSNVMTCSGNLTLVNPGSAADGSSSLIRRKAQQSSMKAFFFFFFLWYFMPKASETTLFMCPSHSS